MDFNAHYTTRSVDWRERISVLGLGFNRLTQAGLLDAIEEMIHEGGTHWIATANVQHVCLAERQPEFRQILEGADAVTADGMPIVWIARLLGLPLEERVTGSDLLMPLAERASRSGWRLFLAGGSPGVPEKVADLWRHRFPAIKIAGTHSPPFLPFEELAASDANRRFIEHVKAARPQILLLALGAPKQEYWIHRYLGEVQVPVAIGVGGSLDFLAGAQRRAPSWMRRCGLEWAHRALTSPGRLLPRYLRDFPVLLRLASRMRRRRPEPGSR